MPVSKRLRYEILRRDGYICRYCGARAPEVQLTVDHVIPVTLGGDDEPSNLVAACMSCNAGKSSINLDHPLIEQVSDDALRWARAMREAAMLQSRSRDALQSYRDQFLERWDSWTWGHEGGRFPLPDSWPDSLEQFQHAGLGIEVVLELVDKACRSRQVRIDQTFRYFCGCCWRTIRERQDIASGLLAREER